MLPTAPTVISIKIVVMLFVTLLATGANGAPLYRPEQVRRTLNTDQYALSIQKNNMLDLQALDGSPIANNVFPAITLAGKDPRALKVDYRQSTRVSINTALGKGNGMHFVMPECEWLIATYPGQPFITIDLTFINTSKKTQEVAALSPWTGTEKSRSALYAGSTNAGDVPIGPDIDNSPEIAPTTGKRVGHTGVVNPANGEALIAGYLSYPNGSHTIQLSEKNDEGAFREFGAWCTFDPPIAVAPGDRLEAGTFYIALREPSLAGGLHRFATASARLVPFPRLQAPYRHGWNADAQTPLDEATLFAAIDALQGLHAPEWAYIHLGTAWRTSTTSMEVDQHRFPGGLEKAAAYAHAQDVRLGLTLPTNEDAPAALAAFVAASANWGIDSVELRYDNATTSYPPQEIYDALDTAAFAGQRPPYVRPVDTQPADLIQWAQGGRQFYLAASGNPRLAAQHTLPLQDSSAMTDNQFAAAFSLLALQQQNLRPTIPIWEQSTLRQQILTRLIHHATQPALPLDLAQSGAPRIWHLPLKTDVGVWNIVGLFNWDKTAPKTARIPLTQFGLNSGVRYTVYDFWANTYVGMIADELQIEIPPESVRLLGLRYAEQRPMLVASNRRLTQGALDHTALKWNHETQRLSGAFNGTAHFPYTLTFRIPPPYQLKSMECSEAIANQTQAGESLSITFTPKETGPITWQAQF